jgi:hypothetical protein
MGVCGLPHTLLANPTSLKKGRVPNPTSVDILCGVYITGGAIYFFIDRFGADFLAQALLAELNVGA